MDIAHAREVLTQRDLPETIVSEPHAKWIKVALRVALVVGIVCAVAAVEIELLHSGALVVVMPE